MVNDRLFYLHFYHRHTLSLGCEIKFITSARKDALNDLLSQYGQWPVLQKFLKKHVVRDVRIIVAHFKNMQALMFEQDWCSRC